MKKTLDTFARLHADQGRGSGKFVGPLQIGVLFLGLMVAPYGNLRGQTVLTSAVISPTIDPITDSAGKILDAGSPPEKQIFNPSWDLRCVDQPAPLLAPTGKHLTWGDWSKVTGRTELKCIEKTGPDGKMVRGTEIHAKLEGLIPEGVYSFWIVLFGEPGFEPNFKYQVGGGSLGPPDGSENKFVASATGSMEWTRFQNPGPLSQFGELPGCLADQYEIHLWGAYHPDGKTYGAFAGPLVPGPNGQDVENGCVFATQFYLPFIHDGPPTLKIETAVFLSWASLSGGGAYVVETAAKANGPWEASNLPVTTEGIYLRVAAATSDKAKYFRLTKKR